MALRWGIVSAGLISNDFVSALGILSPEDHEVVAVAARDIKRSYDFAKRFGIPKAYGDYKQLAKDPKVEIAYVGVINTQHFEVTRLLLENGKHVLVEKPLCMNQKEAKELIELAQRKKLFLMEAIWSRFFPSYKYVAEQIKNGKLGEIKSVETEFGNQISHFDRISKKELGGGTVLDIGIYAIQIIQFVIQQTPESIKSTGKLNSSGVDYEVQAKLIFANNVIASIKLSAVEKLLNTAVIKGTKGQITLKEFWCATTIIDVDGQEKTWPLPKSKETKSNFGNCLGLSYEAEEVRRCIRKGETECKEVSHSDSLIIAGIEDRIRHQIGVIYPADE